MLNLNWYSESPIDFEYKNYVLLDYLMKIDESYSNLKLSPYLLWTEKLVSEMEIFINYHSGFKNNLKKKIKEIRGFEIIYHEEDLSEIGEIIEIVDYSKPILESKIKMGYKIFEKYPQLLF